MKRSYPYTGPGASPSRPQAQQMAATATPPSQPTPDYSAYGYGANSALMSGASSNVASSLSQEAQQAQWHQQWQQYYAQQAASAAGGQPQQGAVPNRPPQQMQPQPTMHSQPFGFQQQPQYYGQPQQPSMPPAQQAPNASYAWPNQQQAGTPGYQPQPYNAALGQQQPQAYYANPNLPAAKRPRFDSNGPQQNGAVPMRPMNQSPGPGYQPSVGGGGGPQAFPGAPNGHTSFQGNVGWQNGNATGPGPARMGPMRGGGPSPHLGGPSNMAGPMAASPPGIRAPSMPRGIPNRPGRPQIMPNRPAIPAMPAAAGKFNGPVGVNALTTQGRGGFGRPSPAANVGARRPIVGLRNGIPSGPSGKANRFEQSKGKGNIAARGAASKATGESSKGAISAAQPASMSKRAFSDFRIKAISIDPIDWQWQQGEDEGEEDDEAGGDEDEPMQSSNDVDSVNGSVQGSKKTRLGKRKEKAEAGKETSRLRICFAAHLPPPGAPTGPKALTRAAEKEEVDQGATAEIASTSDEPEWTAFSRGPPQSSTNRISISYTSSKRRMVIDSDVIKSLEVDRAKGCLKIVVDVTTAAGVKRRDQLEKKKGEEWVVVKGVLLEGRESEADNFSAISRRELEKCWRIKGAWEEEEEAVEEEEEAVEEEELTEEVVEEGMPEIETEVKQEEDGEIVAEELENEGEGQADEKIPDAHSTEGVEGTDDVKTEEVDAEEEKDVAWQDYTSLPPLFRLLAKHDGPSEDEHHPAADSGEMTITVMLAEVSSKQELRWVKTGDVEEWLSALPGFQPSFASTSGAKIVHAWTDKIRVVDPDPPPTLVDVLQDWASKSFVGSVGERRRFLEVHRLQSTSGMSDLICKLVRGERSIPTPNARELGAPLKEAIEGNAFQQNHITGSVLAIVRLVKEYAGLAGVGDEAVEARLQEIFMCLPSQQIFRACDGLLKEHLEKQRLSNTGRGKAALPAVPGVKRAEEKAGKAKEVKEAKEVTETGERAAEGTGVQRMQTTDEEAEKGKVDGEVEVEQEKEKETDSGVSQAEAEIVDADDDKADVEVKTEEEDEEAGNNELEAEATAVESAQPVEVEPKPES